MNDSINLAQKAGRLARLGQFEIAREILADLRIRNNGANPVVTGWIFLAEAIVDRSSNRSKKGAENIQRAYALGKATKNNILLATSAAWLSSAAYNQTDIRSAVAYWLEAIQNSTLTDHEARSRANIVLADCLNLSGEIERAKQFYALARQHAVSARDLSMQNALIYNAAMFSVFHLNLSQSFGLMDPHDISISDLLVESSANLDSGIQSTAQATFVTILRAKIRFLREQWPEALALYDDAIPKAPADGLQESDSILLAERAICKYNLSDFNGSRSDLYESINTVDKLSGSDQRALASSQIARIAMGLGIFDLSKEYQQKSTGYLLAFRSDQESWREAIASSIALSEYS
jgi:tetratricopeptide (TPR) repeat protein